jgi:glutamine cyclotransferase
MKKTLFPIFLLGCLFITFFSCSNKSKSTRKPVSAVNFVPEQNEYALGSSFTVNVTTKLNGGELEKIELYHNDRLLVTETKPDFSFQMNSLNTVGPNTIRVVTTKKDGNNNSRYKPFFVVSDKAPVEKNFEIVAEHPHSTKAFTEGLLMHKGFLFESTGNPGESFIYKTTLNSGKVVMEKKLDNRYFGEGITIFKDKIYQLTYKTKIGFIYDLESFALVDSFHFSSDEGWGMTTDGVNLIMSDGTSRLTWLDPNTLQPVKYLYVANNKAAQEGLNELEFVNGSIFANVWMKNYIVEIDANSGKITSTTDVSELLNRIPMDEPIDVLNGIAYLESSGNFLLTGKYWPKIFEIKIGKSK